MTRRQCLGMLLIVAGYLSLLVLWLLDVKFVKIADGPETFVGKIPFGPTQADVYEKTNQLEWNLLPAVPSILLAAVGFACLLIPSRRRNH